MGLLYSPRFVATNNTTGAILPGARLYTFDAIATTTPKATYSDPDLSTSNGAYVVADALGVFPPIFGPSNDQYYMELRTPSGIVVDQFPFVATLGPDETSIFLKDLGVNGRFQVRGAGGVVEIEAGNPEGDDVGGSARLGGWMATQGDDLSIDFAATRTTGALNAGGNLTAEAGLLVVGDVTLNGVAKAVPRILARGSGSGLTFNIALDGAFEAWAVFLRNVVWTSNSTDLSAKFSFDGAATFKGGANEYAYTFYNGGAVSATSGQATSALITTALAGAPSAGVIGGDVALRVTSKVGRSARFGGEYDFFEGGASISAQRTGRNAATCQNSNYGKATHIQIIGSSVLAFDYLVIGLS